MTWSRASCATARNCTYNEALTDISWGPMCRWGCWYSAAIAAQPGLLWRCCTAGAALSWLLRASGLWMGLVVDLVHAGQSHVGVDLGSGQR